MKKKFIHCKGKPKKAKIKKKRKNLNPKNLIEKKNNSLDKKI